MQRRRSYERLSLPVRGGEANSDANERPARAGDGSAGDNSCDHLVGAQDFRNMRLAIGTVEKSIFEMSLSDNLTGTRHIDICLRRNVGNVAAGPEEQAAVVEPGGGNGSRFKITVATDEPDADQDYLEQMRGWLMAVATLFVGITFQAAIQPPQWALGALQGRPKDANTLASGPAAAPSPTSSAHQQAATNKFSSFLRMAINKLTGGEAKRASYYYSFNGTAFVVAVSLLLVLVLARRGTPAAGRAMNIVKYSIPYLCVAVGFTFVVAMSRSWRMTAFFLVMYVVYGALLTVYMLGKGGACTKKLRRLFCR